MAGRDPDPNLDRWWSPPDLAQVWRMDPKTVRAHLRRLNDELGHRLFPEAAKHIRILGAVLEKALPGCFSRNRDPGSAKLVDLRAVAARLSELESWRDTTDEWRESATAAIRRALGER